MGPEEGRPSLGPLGRVDLVAICVRPGPWRPSSGPTLAPLAGGLAVSPRIGLETSYVALSGRLLESALSTSILLSGGLSSNRPRDRLWRDVAASGGASRPPTLSSRLLESTLYTTIFRSGGLSSASRPHTLLPRRAASVWLRGGVFSDFGTVLETISTVLQTISTVRPLPPVRYLLRYRA